MKRNFIIAAVGALLLLAASAVAKVPNPLQGSLAPEQATAAVGRTVRLTLTLETASPFDAVELSIKLPPGVALVKGKPVSEILDFKPGEKKIFGYSVRVREKGEQRIIVTAKVKNLGPNEAFSKVFSSVINPQPTRDNSVLTTDSDGTQAIVTTVPTTESK